MMNLNVPFVCYEITASFFVFNCFMYINRFVMLIKNPFCIILQLFLVYNIFSYHFVTTNLNTPVKCQVEGKLQYTHTRILNFFTAYPFLSVAFHSTKKEVCLGSSDGMVINFLSINYFSVSFSRGDLIQKSITFFVYDFYSGLDFFTGQPIQVSSFNRLEQIFCPIHGKGQQPRK